MKRTFKIFYFLFLVLMMPSCMVEELKEKANQQFGDQHFKTAISLIELHKIREGEYPTKLKNLKHLGDWDKIIYSSVSYNKLDMGYELNLVNGFMGAPKKLKYPKEFWQGLGVVKSNMKE